MTTESWLLLEWLLLEWLLPEWLGLEWLRLDCLLVDQFGAPPLRELSNLFPYYALPRGACASTAPHPSLAVFEPERRPRQQQP